VTKPYGSRDYPVSGLIRLLRNECAIHSENRSPVARQFSIDRVVLSGHVWYGVGGRRCPSHKAFFAYAEKLARARPWGRKMKTQLVCIGVWLCASTARADTTWTDWSSVSVGQPGAAIGSLNGVTVNYAGEVTANSRVNGFTVWRPASTYVGGAVNVSPDVIGAELAPMVRP
jgi:hypothetical protein